MPKTIVILLDGTSNEISEHRTNILRLYGCLRKDDRQIVYYDPGVGTFGGADDWLGWTRKAKEIWGLVTGWGLDRNVKEAYRFLVEHYDPGRKGTKSKPAIDPDTICIFGFSRGAYTARVLAGFIHAFGIMEPTQLNLLDYAYRTYKGISDGRPPADDDDAAADPNAAFRTMRLYERALDPHRPDIKLLGLFDTVASVIEPGRWFLRLRTHAFSAKNPSVEHVRHAVGIDEQRTMYNPQLWPAGGQFTGPPFKQREPVAQDVKEVWFAGSHGDVGGGYPERDSVQAKIPLLWMIRETAKLGIRYYQPTVKKIVEGANPDFPKYVAPGSGQPINGSMTPGWALVEFVPRRIPPTSFRKGGKKGWYLPLFDRRRIPEGAAIDESVFDRMRLERHYRPANLLAISPRALGIPDR